MSQTTPPTNVISCVVHQDPYPFYRELLRNRPLYYDETLAAWVATSAKAVSIVLSHPCCAVRPNLEPVPAILVGTKAGLIFQHLVRMNEGDVHINLRSALARQTKAFPLQSIEQISQHWSENLLNEHDFIDLNQFAADLPVYVQAELIGFPPYLISSIVKLVHDFALCMNPLNDAVPLEKGIIAAENLMSLIYQQENLAIFKQLAEQTSREVAAANLIGLMFQAYEATAGLIGNTLNTLATYSVMRKSIENDNSLLEAFVKEVIRWDPSVQNTRRFLTSDSLIHQKKMLAGDAVVVVLAAANRDDRVNPNPERFTLHRENRKYYTFGLRRHLCLGERIALIITQAAIKRVLAVEADRLINPHATTYRPYGNLRIPNLRTKQELVS